MSHRLHFIAAVGIFLIGLVVAIVAYLSIGHSTPVNAGANGYAGIVPSSKPSIVPFLIGGGLMAVGVIYAAWSYLRDNAASHGSES